MKPKRKLRTPFFVVNPKAYLYGEKALELALAADQLALEYDLDILFTVQLVDLAVIKAATERLILTVQHLDGIEVGRGMGFTLPEGVVAAGGEATFLNHAEHPISLAELAKAMKRSDELGILTIVCADSIDEARAITMLKPDVLLCEPTELIGTGQTSDDTYMLATNQMIHEIDSDILILQAAGISSAEDVAKALLNGADATGGTSGIVCAAEPNRILREMVAKVAEVKRGAKE